MKTGYGHIFLYVIMTGARLLLLSVQKETAPSNSLPGLKYKDINSLDYTHAWMRYLNGDAEIGVTPLELEATLGFKISNRKTIIFSLDLHFYDEVYEHLTIPEDFERYISDHSNRLRIANENRHKMNRN